MRGAAAVASVPGMKTSGLFVVGVVLALLGGCGDDDDGPGESGGAGASAQAGTGGTSAQGPGGAGGDDQGPGGAGSAGASAGTGGAGGTTGGSSGASGHGGTNGGSSGASGQSGAGGSGVVCNQVAVNGAFVAATEVKTLPALQAGGTLAAGTYVLTSAETTATELIASRRATLVLTATPGDLHAELTTQIEGVEAVTYAGSVQFTGATQVTFTWTCPAGLEPWVRGYASDSKTTMTIQESGLSLVFTRQ